MSELALTDDAREILDATESVEVLPYDPTIDEDSVWVATLSYAGLERTITFDPVEIVNDDAVVIREKIADWFFEITSIDGEEWHRIQDEWTDQQVFRSAPDQNGGTELGGEC